MCDTIMRFLAGVLDFAHMQELSKYCDNLLGQEGQGVQEENTIPEVSPKATECRRRRERLLLRVQRVL